MRERRAFPVDGRPRRRKLFGITPSRFQQKGGVLLRWITVASCLVACGTADSLVLPNDGGTDAPTTPLNDGGIDADASDASMTTNALRELARTCSAAGGQFVAGECACPTDPTSAVRKSFDARGGGSCTLPDSGDSE